MSGNYVTQKRTYSIPSWTHYSSGGSSRRVSHVLKSGSRTVLPFQETYSYRTGKSLTPQEAWDGEVEAFTRTRRNAFTTQNPKTDEGHEFWTHRLKFDASKPVFAHSLQGSYAGKPIWQRGSMPIWLEMKDLRFPNEGPYFPSKGEATTSRSDVNHFGSRAIAATQPLNPNADIAQTVIESLVKLPQMVGAAFWKEQTSIARAAGSEYLNYQFGWAPLIRDIRAATSSLLKATKTIRQIMQDNGKNVRRRYYFPNETLSDTWTIRIHSTTSINGRSGYMAFKIRNLDGSYASSAPATVLRSRSRDISFSGCFTYKLPTESSIFDKLSLFEAKANVLLGTRITPATLWELAPWSWLVDWKLNLGTILGNASALSSDGLLLRYGYLMVHTKDTAIVKPDRVLLGPANLGNYPYQPPTLRVISERKERFAASPFGFGLTPGDFSPAQIAILTALGISRS